MDPLKVSRWSERAIAFLLGAVVATLIILFGIPSAHAQTVDLDTTSIAGSNSEANSASHSGANAESNQEQGNVQATMLNFEASTIPTKTTQKFKTNASVPLAASVSFSSDYCGGTASAGASGFGLSLGAAVPKMDGNCQALRRAEKFGVAAANAYSAGLTDMAGKLVSMQTWEICMAGNDAVQSTTAEACERLGLIGGGEPAIVEAAAPAPAAAPPPQVDYTEPRNPRGAVDKPTGPAIITGSDGRSVQMEAAKL